jgi:dolichyl-phosphate beta-glucosyltransferase
MNSGPELSIVIPSYNEEKRLPRTLNRIREYFSGRPLPLDQIEVIVVDDGSSDGTVRVAQEWAAKWSSVRLLSNDGNRGKGYSVRNGMLQARGRLALFTDADLSAPIEESEKLFAALKAGNQVAIGSRAIDRSLISKRQSWLRESAGVIFNLLVRLFTWLPVHDTQCGFKLFELAPARIIFEQQRIKGWGFDPEILFLAKRQGLSTAEVPIRWAHDEATKVRVVRASVTMFGDLIYIRWNWLLGRYPRRQSA